MDAQRGDRTAACGQAVAISTYPLREGIVSWNYFPQSLNSPDVALDWILQRLRRITLTTAYLPEIDGLRFIAIVGVIFCHIAGDIVLRHGVTVQAYLRWLYNVLIHGERGVQLFFTISGFVLGLPFARRYVAQQGPPLNMRRYFRRRLLRLEPPYLLNVVVCTLATWVVVPSLRATLFSHFITAISYTHLLVFHYDNPINMIWWSLEIETQFYMLMPLLALILKVKDPWVRRGVITAVAASAFFWQTALANYWIVSWTLLGHIQFFLVGLVLADLYQSGLLSRQPGARWDVIGSLAVVTLFTLPGWWRMAAPLLTFCILAGALRGNRFRRLLSLPWIAAIGGMCYTIYLWHVFVMAIVLKVSIRLPIGGNFLLSLVVQTAIILPVIFFFSVVVFLAVEKPCMEPDWPAMALRYVRTALPRKRGRFSRRRGTDNTLDPWIDSLPPSHE